MLITLQIDPATNAGQRVVAIVTTKMSQVGVAQDTAFIVQNVEIPPSGAPIQMEVKPGQYMVLEPYAEGA